MGWVPPTQRGRLQLRLRAAATNATYFLAVALLTHTIFKSLRDQLQSNGTGPWAPTQTLSDTEIEEVCKRYAVPEPPPYRPEKAALAAALVHQLATGGLYAHTGNKTFTDLMVTLTLGERERMAMEAETVMYHTYEEAMAQQAAEEVRPGRMGRSQAAQGHVACAFQLRAAASLAICVACVGCGPQVMLHLACPTA